MYVYNEMWSLQMHVTYWICSNVPLLIPAHPSHVLGCVTYFVILIPVKNLIYGPTKNKIKYNHSNFVLIILYFTLVQYTHKDKKNDYIQSGFFMLTNISCVIYVCMYVYEWSESSLAAERRGFLNFNPRTVCCWCSCCLVCVLCVWHIIHFAQIKCTACAL